MKICEPKTDKKGETASNRNTEKNRGGTNEPKKIREE